MTAITIRVHSPLGDIDFSKEEYCPFSDEETQVESITRLLADISNRIYAAYVVKK